MGKSRRGDLEWLAGRSRTLGFELRVIEPLELEGLRIGSRQISTMIEAGDIEAASKAMRFPPQIRGQVVEGQQIGRTIGFPTANLALQRAYSVPANGVYAVRARWRSLRGTDTNKSSDHASELPGPWSESYKGAANIGIRPTIGSTQKSIEVHILDFEADLYGLEMEVEFIERLRDEKKFDGLPALIDAIETDVRTARKILDQ